MASSSYDETRRSSDPPKELSGRVCAVCSDRANGYNFGVLSCESCKAFFRRNAMKQSEIKCPFSNACQITSISRKFCQACRLSKCFAVGMNSDWLHEQKIRGNPIKRKTKIEDEKKEKEDDEQVSVSKVFLQKLMKQANEKQTSCICNCQCGFYPSGTRLMAYVSTTPSFSNSPISVVATSPISPSVNYLSPYTNPYSPSWNYQTFRPQIQSTYEPSAFHTIESNRRNGIDKYRNVLSADEIALLEELHILNVPLNAPLEQNYNQESLSDVFQIVVEALRRIISMAAQLKSFRELDIEDRKQLLKSGFCELLIVRGIMAYNKTNNSWNHHFANNKMEVKIEILKQDPASLEHYEMHKKLLESFSDEIRNNENIMLTLNAIVIFHPHVSHLKDSSKVHAAQARYFALLLKILRYEFTKEKADRAYKSLLDVVIDLHRVNQTMLHIFYGFDPSQLDPLVRELCNFE